MFKSAKRRRSDAIMAAARYMVGCYVDHCAKFGDRGLQLTPKSIAGAALFQHDIRITAAEARAALTTALAEQGYGPDRITTGYDR